MTIFERYKALGEKKIVQTSISRWRLNVKGLESMRHDIECDKWKPCSNFNLEYYPDDQYSVYDVS